MSGARLEVAGWGLWLAVGGWLTDLLFLGLFDARWGFGRSCLLFLAISSLVWSVQDSPARRQDLSCRG